MAARPKSFGALLARLRRAKGFKSAYAFYHARDGRRWLRLSFANYLALESGRSLPKPWRVPRLAQALGLEPGTAEAGELARTYLACLEGADAVLKLAGVGEARGAGGPEEGLSEAAAQQALNMRTVNLTFAQWKALMADRAAYLSHVYLVNTPGWNGIDAIAKALDLPAPSVRQTLKGLARARIVELSGTRARTRFAKQLLAQLPLSPESAGIKGAQDRYRLEFAEQKGRLRRSTLMTVRMPRAGMERYATHLHKAVRLGAVFGDVDPGPETAVYLIDGRIFELFP